MQLREIRWRLAVGGALATEVILVLAAFGWVALYSYLIHPGEPAEFYQRYAMGASPWVAVLAGVPLFYLAGRWVRAREQGGTGATALALFGCYLLLEAPFVLGGDNPLMPSWLPYAGYAGKGVTIYLGVTGRGRSEPIARET